MSCQNSIFVYKLRTAVEAEILKKWRINSQPQPKISWSYKTCSGMPHLPAVVIQTGLKNHEYPVTWFVNG